MLYAMLHPEAFRRVELAKKNKNRFVHYTSAYVATQILKQKEIWMRNATVMNDWREIDYGLDCIFGVMADGIPEGDAFKKAIESVYPDAWGEVSTLFDKWLPHFRYNTYMTCVSEHKDGPEDVLGRLSMWRAYGGDAGVAIVLRPEPFFAQATAGIMSSPVSYFTPDQIRAQTAYIASVLGGDAEAVRNTFSKDMFVRHVWHMLRFAVLCTKHPGFEEELEWRIIYSPAVEVSPYVEEVIEVVGGVTQKVEKLKLEADDGTKLMDLEMNQIIDSVIIGPTQYPHAMHEAFGDLLGRCGLDDPYQKVRVSNIPLRV